MEAVERRVFETIKSIGITLTESQFVSLKDIFSDEKVVNPFHSIETEYLQELFIQENFNYVVSLFFFSNRENIVVLALILKERTLGRVSNQLSDGSIMCHSRNLCSHYL